MKPQRNIQCVVVKYSALARYRCACTLFALATGAFDKMQVMVRMEMMVRIGSNEGVMVMQVMQVIMVRMEMMVRIGSN